MFGVEHFEISRKVLVQWLELSGVDGDNIVIIPAPGEYDVRNLPNYFGT